MISTADFNSIRELDLSQIKLKLMHIPSGEGWSAAKADAVEHEYRRFLCLMKAFPHESTVPLEDVDTFWHYHILDTVKYARDCRSAFGYFLHHHPYVGIDSAGDDAERDRSGLRMQELYEQRFGASYEAAAQKMSQAGAYCSATGAGAYCSATAANAYCSATAAKAYCSATAPKAYCSATAAKAYCSVTAGNADCSTTALKAYCSATASNAYCSAPPAKAYCSATVGNAYCSATAAAYCSAGADAAPSNDAQLLDAA